MEEETLCLISSCAFSQIYRDRKVFSSRVFEVASSDLAGMGIVVISYTIKEVSDEVGYLKVTNMYSAILRPDL
jgi:flotillin